MTVQPAKLAQYQAYSLANQTAPKTRQIVMLYDGAIRNLRQAVEAIEQKQVEQRYNLLVKTSDIILGLQGCLDFDNGGEVAKLLFDYYSSIDSRLIGLHRHPSVDGCNRIIKELKDMRDAWSVIDQQVETAAASQKGTLPTGIVSAPPAGESPQEEMPPSSGTVEISA